MNPKVFLSHASEDKDRFVLKFAEKLRARGVDVWLDKWEMFPGDSLIDKIFEEGLKNSKAVIIVLSENSVNKRWVREELNAAMVKRINDGSKLIPIIIDDCEVPECLQSTVLEKVKDINNYGNELERVIVSIFEQVTKPPLGYSPKYTYTILDSLPGLNKVDTIIFNKSCQKAIEKGDLWVEKGDIFDELKELEIPDEEISDSLEVLDIRGYIKAERVLDGNIPIFFITNYGFDNYAIININGYDNIIRSVIFKIINEEMEHNYQIADNLKQPVTIVNHILDSLQSNNLLKVSKTSGGNVDIFYTSPELKRIIT